MARHAAVIVADGDFVLGHRGARGLYPENTLEGFRAGIDDGVRAFELDVAVTADGVPVVHHNPALAPDMTRGANGRWIGDRPPLIRDMSLRQLRSYDVGRARPGSATASRFPDQRPIDGARVPTLESVLSLPSVRFLVEIKTFPDHPEWTMPLPRMVEATMTAARKAGALDRMTVESFDWAVVRYMRTHYPEIPRAWLSDAESAGASALWWGVEVAEPAGCSAALHAVAAESKHGEPNKDAWAPGFEDLTRQDVDEAHRLGVRVMPWTVNDPQDMRRLINWGVDGIISDRPDLCLAVLEQKTEPAPAD